MGETPLGESISPLHPLVFRILLFSFLVNFWFIVPVFVIFLRDHGISYTGIGTLETVSLLMGLLLLLPSGAIGDVKGRKRIALLGSLLFVSSYLVFVVGSTFSLFLLAYTLWALGDVLYHVSVEPWFYDLLKIENMAREYVRVMGWRSFVSSISFTLGASLGGILYEINPRLPFLADAVSFSLGVLVLLTLRDVKPSRHKRVSIGRIASRIRSAARIIRRNRLLSCIIGFSLLVPLATSVFVGIAEQPYLQSLGFSVTAIGLIVAITKGLPGFINVFAGRIEKILGDRTSTLLTGFGTPILLLLVLYSTKTLVVPLLFVLYLMRHYSSIVLSAYQNHLVPTRVRASVNSIRILLSNTLGALVFFLAGWLMDIFSLRTVMVWIGLVSLVAALVLATILLSTRESVPRG